MHSFSLPFRWQLWITHWIISNPTSWNFNCLASIFRAWWMGIKRFKNPSLSPLQISYTGFPASVICGRSFILLTVTSCTYITLVCKYFEKSLQCTDLLCTPLRCCYCHQNQSGGVGAGEDYRIDLKPVSNTTAENIHQKPVMWGDRKGRWFLIYGLISGSSLSKAEAREESNTETGDNDRRKKAERGLWQNRKQKNVQAEEMWQLVGCGKYNKLTPTSVLTPLVFVSYYSIQNALPIWHIMNWCVTCSEAN